MPYYNFDQIAPYLQCIDKYWHAIALLLNMKENRLSLPIDIICHILEQAYDKPRVCEFCGRSTCFSFVFYRTPPTNYEEAKNLLRLRGMKPKTGQELMDIYLTGGSLQTYQNILDEKPDLAPTLIPKQYYDYLKKIAIWSSMRQILLEHKRADRAIALRDVPPAKVVRRMEKMQIRGKYGGKRV